MNEQPATPTPAPEGAPGLSSGPVKGPSNAGPRTLAIDIGGTGLKASVLDDKGAMLVDRVRIPTTYPLAPQALIDALRTLVAPLPAYERIAAGFPGMVRGGRVLSAPHFVTQDGPGTRIVPLLVAAWLEEWGWDRLVWHERAALFPGPALLPGPEALALLVPLLALPQATHYVLDAWIWRVRPENPDLARQLGF